MRYICTLSLYANKITQFFHFGYCILNYLTEVKLQLTRSFAAWYIKAWWVVCTRHKGTKKLKYVLLQKL